VALALSNYLHGPRIALLSRACDRLGIELRQAGAFAPTGPDSAIVALNEADIVFGKARVIYEALACGRAAYVFDHNGGDGWVTAANFQKLSADNFGGQSGTFVIDDERLVRDLAEYEPGMGTVNRDLVIASNSAARHATELVGVLERLVPRRAPVNAPLDEIARLIRLYHRADAQAFVLQAETTRLGARIHSLDAECAVAHNALSTARDAAEQARADAAAQAAAAEQARADAAAHASEAERASVRLNELTASRRWRAACAVLRPADRLRATLRRARSWPGSARRGR
jgi:hypothetical protein